ncbi:hypothetical protein UB33_15890 [Photobacterium angustum]|uniref:hypothetical protein n=1 Tax=Photobacterium angustum TaxID=661 RepID=UPI0005E43227|nr:hypothetical protein [Photobacterium angustum]KJF93953.1 hypothetical protein UB39_13450 [Photobacterium angustum]KJG05129.1 hypothetical protein UB33_15890 [Photobacterium angustum]PSV94402.1 hypothetical protein CTN01_07735 [Photobacterium angustum]PSW81808.1 hypothetical protein CTN03_07185 [Photobacterium angustum]
MWLSSNCRYLSSLLIIVTFSLLLTACDDDSRQEIALNAKGYPDLSRVVAYSATTPNHYLACAKNYRNSCLVSHFPPIGLTFNTAVTLTDIEQRIFVSHPWMAERFLSVLALLPSEVLSLFRSVSAIVIADDIRPSFYSANTATIYIDPRYIWRNEEEWLTIIAKQDFRDQFQANVQFLAVRQSVDSEGNYAPWVSNEYAENNTMRTTEQLLPALFRLLVHELAHAVDAIPPASLISLDPRRTIYQNISSISPLNKALYDQFPLQDDILFDAANVLYDGVTPSYEISTLTASQVGAHFEVEGASDLYGYSNRKEDMAMLFQSYMMYEHFGLQDRFLFLSQNEGIALGCNRYTVEWGQTGRMFDPLVYERMMLAAEIILQPALPARSTPERKAVPIPAGTPWCEMIDD